MTAKLDEIIASIKEMGAEELEQLLDVAQEQYERVSSPAAPVLEGEPSEGVLPPVEALEDADMDYDREMADVKLPPSVMPGADMPEEEEDFPMTPTMPRR